MISIVDGGFVRYGIILGETVYLKRLNKHFKVIGFKVNASNGDTFVAININEFNKRIKHTSFDSYVLRGHEDSYFCWVGMDDIEQLKSALSLICLEIRGEV